jgi:hypothetical protein
MLILIINVAIIVVIGVICFSLIDWFVRGKQLGNLLKVLVALICLAAVEFASARVSFQIAEFA